MVWCLIEVGGLVYTATVQIPSRHDTVVDGDWLWKSVSSSVWKLVDSNMNLSSEGALSHVCTSYKLNVSHNTAKEYVIL